MKKVNLGQLVITRGVNEEMRRNENFTKFVAESLVKYRNCDWGNTHPEDLELNDKAALNGWRIVAKYVHNDWNIFIITEWDRSVTTILFSEEY